MLGVIPRVIRVIRHVTRVIPPRDSSYTPGDSSHAPRDWSLLPVQILLQFPLSFEFNEHFLCTLAYHHVSMRFRTFLLDSEHERYESGWLSEEEGKHRGKSLWDYIEVQKRKAPIYYNFLYKPSSTKVTAHGQGGVGGAISGVGGGGGGGGVMVLGTSGSRIARLLS